MATGKQFLIGMFLGMAALVMLLLVEMLFSPTLGAAQASSSSYNHNKNYNYNKNHSSYSSSKRASHANYTRNHRDSDKHKHADKSCDNRCKNYDNKHHGNSISYVNYRPKHIQTHSCSRRPHILQSSVYSGCSGSYPYYHYISDDYFDWHGSHWMNGQLLWCDDLERNVYICVKL